MKLSVMNDAKCDLYYALGDKGKSITVHAIAGNELIPSVLLHVCFLKSTLRSFVSVSL